MSVVRAAAAAQPAVPVQTGGVDVDVVFRDLAWFHAKAEAVREVVAELRAVYGAVEEWDGRTWDEYVNRVEAEAWRRVAAAFGGAR